MRTILISLMIFGIAAPAAQAELHEIAAIDCHMLPGTCIEKGGKYYIEASAEDIARLKNPVTSDWLTEKVSRYHAGGWCPTAASLRIFDLEKERLYPGAKALMEKYGMSGSCEVGNMSDMDCYASHHVMHNGILKKFDYIKDPVKRADVALQDRLAFDTWLNAQPLYTCGFKGWNAEAVCAGCSVQIGPELGSNKRPVSCEEGLSKMAETKKILSREFYQAWKNPMGSATGTAAGAGAKIEPAGGAFRPFKPVSSGSTKKKTDEEPPAYVIGGKYTD